MEIFDKLFGMDVTNGRDRSTNPRKQTSLGKKNLASSGREDTCLRIRNAVDSFETLYKNHGNIAFLRFSCEGTSLNRLGVNLFLTCHTRAVTNLKFARTNSARLLIHIISYIYSKEIGTKRTDSIVKMEISVND